MVDSIFKRNKGCTPVMVVDEANNNKAKINKSPARLLKSLSSLVVNNSSTVPDRPQIEIIHEKIRTELNSSSESKESTPK